MLEKACFCHIGFLHIFRFVVVSDNGACTCPRIIWCMHLNTKRLCRLKKWMVSYLSACTIMRGNRVTVVLPLFYHGLPRLPCKGRPAQAPNSTTLLAKLFRNAFVKFPAILMGRKEGEDSYSEIKNYSSKCVSKLAVFGE